MNRFGNEFAKIVVYVDEINILKLLKELSKATYIS